MDGTTLKDINGNEVGIGSAVCLLTSGNFIYGHIEQILENGKVKVKPDIGYAMVKPHFRAKEFYVMEANCVGLVHDNPTSAAGTPCSSAIVALDDTDVVVNEDNSVVET